MTSGDYVKKCRNKSHMTQEKAAESLNIDRSTLSKYERGELCIPLDIVRKMSDLYNVPVLNIINGTEDKNIDEVKAIENLYEENYNFLHKLKFIKKIFIILIIVILLVLLLFFAYYFLNTYNTLNVYKLFIDNDDVLITNGIVVQSRDEVIISLGYIDSNDDIKSIKLFYMDGNDKQILCNTSNVNNVYIVDYRSYEEYINFSNIKSILNNLFVEFNEDESKTYKLNIEKDFANNKLNFEKEYNVTTKVNNNSEDLNTIRFNDEDYLVMKTDSSIIIQKLNEIWHYSINDKILKYNNNGDSTFVYDYKLLSFTSGISNEEKLEEFKNIYKKITEK
jgi:transcriptional regulator with XRE-family HTH domain